ncbi:enediyne biosynthesis protein [Amycolatopsis antarctica]|uniref:Enediyne biosynthesis protein n=1 Tax=Amycolatopsis antarctica TaxID=1854586 RepID=A0A263D0T1_9PSEU|nr:DUF1702 family protein [Amycolatopsis antarctica]OZM72040.1 enediyne biosynthesis protein [Amycolatopsis antarctica]
MATTLGALRRRVLAPSMDAVSFGGRGFPGAGSPAADRLERVPQVVVCGFEWGIDGPALGEIERRLDMIEPELRGFAYEGATMAFTILDAMGPRQRHRTVELMAGPGERHIFLTYIGIGFAMARLPRVLWKKVLPDLAGSAYHPTMSWLAVDGYGFDRAYFDTRRWVDEQHVPAPYAWDGCPEYFRRAVDQGIGRALWFIHGARTAVVTEAVRRFAEHRRADLWSGVGLAATFAGGCDSPGLAALRESAGGHRAEVALGAVFAAKARQYAGFVPAHTDSAVSALAGLTVAEAVGIADATDPGTAPELVPAPAEPVYELWRQRIRDAVTEPGLRLAS